MTATRLGAGLLALGLLAACSGGTGADLGGASTREVLVSRIAEAAGRGPEVTNPRAEITRPRLDVTPTPVLLVEFARTGQGVTLTPSGRNGAVVQWRDGVGSGLALRDGILIATYGLGFDLAGAEVGELRAALRGGGGAIARTDAYLRGDNRIVAVRSTCDVVPRGTEAIDNIGRTRIVRVFDEVCDGADGPFTNRYWVEPDGRVRVSLHRMGGEIGPMRIELLTD
jgi:hypothetical protein